MNGRGVVIPGTVKAQVHHPQAECKQADDAHGNHPMQCDADPAIA